MDKRVIRKWRKMLVRGLITPSEHMLFRKIMELQLENAQLKEVIESLTPKGKQICGGHIAQWIAFSLPTQRPRVRFSAFPKIYFLQNFISYGNLVFDVAEIN